jgi:hypothetical protein
MVLCLALRLGWWQINSSDMVAHGALDGLGIHSVGIEAGPCIWRKGEMDVSPIPNDGRQEVQPQSQPCSSDIAIIKVGRTDRRGSRVEKIAKRGVVEWLWS